MFEPLLHRASAQSWIGYNGPGPTTLLFGNEDAGYFGEVSQAELLTPQSVIDQIPGFNKPAWNPTSTWLKFIYNGKILFISRSLIIGNVSWNTLYAYGMVYGTDDDGVVPNTPARNQIRIVAKDDWRFKVRLIRNDLSDPSYLPTSGVSDTTPRKSEYTDLMYPIMARVIPNHPNKWAAFTDAQLGLSSGYELLRETLASDPAYNFIRSLTAFIIRQKDSTTYSNRVVLELVDTEIFTLSGFISTLTTTLLKPHSNLSFNISSVSGSLLPVSDATQTVSPIESPAISTPRATVDDTSDVLPIVAKARSSMAHANSAITFSFN